MFDIYLMKFKFFWSGNFIYMFVEENDIYIYKVVYILYESLKD